MVNTNKTKSDLRKEYIVYQKNTINKYDKSKEIYMKLVNLENFNKAKVIGIYYSTSNEVDTSLIVNRLLNNKKIVCFPKVEGDVINFYKVNSITDLTNTSIFGIKEPKGDTFTLINPLDIDLIIIPGIAFDKKLNRLGHGKGYYDKYLKKTNAYKIGICFSSQICDNLIVDNNDVKMDLIIDEGGIYGNNNAS